MEPISFSPELQTKLDVLKSRRKSVSIGRVTFSSPLILAPMASIGNAPFRLLMQDMGAGGTVSELISCHGINYQNEKTHEMLHIDEREQTVGLQLFGEDPSAMARAAQVAQEKKATFIDLNLGCPVKKVVQKGGGSALLRDPQALIPYLSTIKAELSVPLTIKIRTGWDANSINCQEVLAVAKECGAEWVAIHGRTRSQGYAGHANWELIEEMAGAKSVPIIGNGDLHTADQVKARMEQTSCQALMIARGCLRNPFIFLEPYRLSSERIIFNAHDYWEVINRYRQYVEQMFKQERHQFIQLRKIIIWYCSGFPGAAAFRERAFKSANYLDMWEQTQRYFSELGGSTKFIDHGEAFMTSGHG